MNTQLPPTRLDRLDLENFRLFGSLRVDLHPNLNVVVAPNGGGKTALLDAIAWVWSYFVDSMLGAVAAGRFKTSDARGRFKESDARRVLSPLGSKEVSGETLLGASGVIADEAFGLTMRALASRRGRASWGGSGNPGPLIQAGAELREAVQSHAVGRRTAVPDLPVVAYYGTGRLWGTNPPPRSKKVDDDDTSRLAGYDDCLAAASRYRAFADWFGRFSQEAVAESPGSPHRAAERIEAVRAAVDLVLKPVGWHHLEWDFPLGRVVAMHDREGRLPVEQLSDGTRNMIGLVGDLAHRAARLNPHLGSRAAQETPGVVLIDEVDMHLHPEWQQTVVASLRAAFPRVQFIVTTHSPQVLSTVDRESIRVLHVDDDGAARATSPGFQTRGVESADVLAQIMGVNPTPRVPEALWVNDYKAMIQQGEGETPNALALREKIVRHFEANHPVVLDCDRMLRFQSFKRSRNLSGASDAKD